MNTAALVAGFVVLLVTVASQVGLMGAHDFVAVALLGLLSAVFCTVVALKTRGRAAFGGLGLSLLPLAMLMYYLATSGG